MKKSTILLSQLALILLVPLSLQAQEKSKSNNTVFGLELTEANKESIENSGYIRCASEEYEAYLQQLYPNRATSQEFEDWLAPKVQEIKTKGLSNHKQQQVVQTLPIVFHIITDGSGAENLADTYIQAQVSQLNIDYRNLAGSSFGVAADLELEFCLAQQDESGSQMTEPGINRVTDFGQGPFTDSYFESTIKPATQWDPTRYFNVWVGDLSGGLLGYAQFPSNSGLAGLNTSGGAANTDGVVVLYSSVGSVANPNPLGAPYASGRTLTHEAGHWLGLRHIWGDGNCFADDYCNDTPVAGSSNFGCPHGTDSCPSSAGADMIENYMDYTDDTCMDTFTADQKTRVLAVMTNSPRRMELPNSNACTPPVIYSLDGRLDVNSLNLANCPTGSIQPEITLTNKGTTTLTSVSIEYTIDINTPSIYNWTGSLSQDQSEIISLPTMAASNGGHTFYVDIASVNSSTDEQTGNDSDSESFSVTGTVCTSVGNTDYLTSTTGVTFNTLSNLNTGKPSGYSDYTSMSTDLNRDSVYDLSIYANSDGNYQVITYVWIDWNQNCVFDDNEQYDLGTSADIANALTVNSPLAITVPSDAVLGMTTMRVTTKYTDPGADQFPTSCENDIAGSFDAEVEDYSVNVLSSLGVDDFGLNQSISLYPNPTTSQLNIKVSTGELPEKYSIYNVLGQVIAQKNITQESDLSIDTSTYSNGMYFIRIGNSNASIVKSFIKK